MGSPPSRDAVPPFTPSHHLKDRLRSFTDFLLSNIDEWSNPHPPCPSPPPPFSFSGSDRFIKGRLPHRTVAISASLSSLFADTAPVTDTFKHGDGSVSNIDYIAHIDSDVGPAPHIPDDDRSTILARTHSETPELSSELDLLRLQVDDSGQGCRLHAPQDTPQNYMVNISTVICLEDHNKSACSQNVDSLPPSHGTLGVSDAKSEVILPATGHSVGGSVVVVAERLLDTQCNSVVSLDITHKGLLDLSVETPVNPEQADEFEEGELSERISDDEQLTSMEEANVEGEGNIQKGSSAGSELEADMQRCSPSGSSSPEKRVLESETDEEMNEPISSFVARRHLLLPKLANQKVSAVNSSSELLIKRVMKKARIEEEQHVLEKTPSPSFGSNEQGILDPINNVRMDEAIRTPNKGSIQQAYAGISQLEAHCLMWVSLIQWVAISDYKHSGSGRRKD